MQSKTEDKKAQYYAMSQFEPRNTLFVVSKSVTKQVQKTRTLYDPFRHSSTVHALADSTTSSKFSTLGENIALKGSARTVPESVKFIVSIKVAGSSRMLKAHKSKAVLMNTELRTFDQWASMHTP